MNLSLAEIPLPLRLRPATPISDEDLQRFCSANDPLRVERDSTGDLIIMTPTGSEGSRLNLRIGRLLDEWAEADGRGVAFDSNGGFALPDGSMRAADVAWIGLERWHALSTQQRKGFAPLCPDFIIEIRSESDHLKELQAKMQQWIANGAQLAWLIDLIEHAITIYRHGEEPNVGHHPSSVQGDGVMTGFELITARIWQ